MKMFFAFILILLINLNFAFAQTKQTIKIPVFRENGIIDSFIDTALTQDAIKNVYGNKPIDKDIWAVMYIAVVGGVPYFSIGIDNKIGVNFSVNIISHEKLSCGYFKYKNFKVFVWANDSLKDFFSKTDKFESFDSVSDLNKAPTIILPPNGSSYDYKDGHFVIDNPPAVR